MKEIECLHCHAITLLFKRDLDYIQCRECKELIKLKNYYSKTDEIIRKNVGKGLFEEVEE